MYQIISLFLISLTISNICYSDDSVYLLKDKPAPFAGYLLPQAKVDEFQKMSRDLTLEKELNDSLTKSVDLYKQNEAIYVNQVKSLSSENEKLVNVQKMSDLEKYLWFGAGILLTGLAVVGAGKLAGH